MKTTDQKTSNIKRSFGNGYKRPVKDENGKLQCHCTNPKPASMGDGTFYCMKCWANWYR